MLLTTKTVGGIKTIFENEIIIHQHVSGEKALVLSSASSWTLQGMIQHLF